MKFKIYYINRYSAQKQSDVKDFSGYEQIVKYSDEFKPVRSNKFISKLIFKFMDFDKPKDYREIRSSAELTLFFKALITGNPVFYLYADKDAFLLPLMKRKFNLKRIKLFGTLHWPEEISSEFAFYKNKIAPEFNGIITLSSSLNPSGAEHKCVIPHGIDLEFWKNNPPSDFENSYLILGISNRDHLGQIEIIKKIQTIDPGAKFRLLMQDKDIYKQYEFLPHLEIIKRKVSDKELKQLYAGSKAVILIQNYCLASNVVLECISMKIPLIANRIGDIDEYLGNDYPLYLDLEGDEKLYKFCRNNDFREEVVNYLGGVRDKFQWKLIAEETVAFIKDNCR